jgi:hypothetical protein
MLTIQKKFKVIQRSERRFVIKHALFPLETTCLLMRCSDLWEVCVKTFVKVANSFTTTSWCHFMTSSKVSCISDQFLFFLKFKSHGSHCLCPSLDTNMFENSFQFTAQGINSHTRTQIWFSNPWWFAVACTCSSNLNYGHYMARNSINALKRLNEHRKFQKFNMTIALVHVNGRKKIQGHTRKRASVRHQTCIVSSQNHVSSREMLRFVRGACQNFCQSGQFFYHSILVPFHEIKQGFMYFWSFFIFFGI